MSTLNLKTLPAVGEFVWICDPTVRRARIAKHRQIGDETVADWEEAESGRKGTIWQDHMDDVFQGNHRGRVQALNAAIYWLEADLAAYRAEAKDLEDLIGEGLIAG